ncbi:MAG: U32 family peptidase, partial [Eggerthellaceae bacterium]|nr:U32 family peptidase [Eggerthellaceae bacterium]
MQRLPELLAPAGNLECLHAAVCAGADAVYLGLDEFNARRNADNFTIAEFGSACEYAHLRGVSIYVILNVEVLPSELGRAVEFARRAWEAGADAFIVQDAGLAAELNRVLPQAELHVSTQMNIHNAAGIEAAARMGAKRVTLARELTVAEIADLASLASDFGMEIECFAHGALCICYSGQCLMSSMIGGRSANRGLCAQACRLPYELHRDDRTGALPAEGEHLLSPRDLCTIDLIGQLQDAGVASLKIEGRMKSADYVHEVVSVYREALDSHAGHPNPKWRQRLAEAFSRGFTTAYLEGQRGNDSMSYGRPNNRGVFVGRIT